MQFVRTGRLAAVQIAPGLTRRIRVLLESLDELWALTWDKLDQV